MKCQCFMLKTFWMVRRRNVFFNVTKKENENTSNVCVCSVPQSRSIPFKIECLCLQSKRFARFTLYDIKTKFILF